MNFTVINICIIVVKETITNVGVLMKQKIFAFYHFKDPVELLFLVLKKIQFIIRKLLLGKCTIGKLPLFLHGEVAIWEIVTWVNVHLGSCLLGSCHLGKYTFRDLMFGKLHIWEVATWENTLGKLPLGKRTNITGNTIQQNCSTNSIVFRCCW